ncbi:MAG TPA: hypothetical protein DCG33_08840 [Prevotellaceae bacterium]|nr:hypothetical protein [Prevotellaceae bacterium]
MKKTIKRFVKNNTLLMFLYRLFGNLSLSIIKPFLRTDDKLILFVSYGGRYYNDSPKYMYEYMKKDPRFADYKLVWAFTDPGRHSDIENRITIDSFKYYKTALKARCWITNVVVERGLDFKGINTFYFHTTHVTLPKYCGYDSQEPELTAVGFRYHYDVSCAQSQYEKELQYSMFGLKESQVIVCGYPKNDRIANSSASEYYQLRQRIGIPEGKKAILYAPTFRGCMDAAAEVNIDFRLWQQELGDDYVLLFRAHPVLVDKLDLTPYAPFVINTTSYPDNVDLMIAADILVSDYSGIFFEFGVQDKPMYAFAYDYDEYIKSRQLYVDIKHEIPGGDLSEKELVSLIKSGLTDEMKAKLLAFRNKYIAEYGSATPKAVDVIYENITR